MKIDVSVELFDMPDRDVAAQRLIVIAREICSGRYSASYSLSKDGPPARRCSSLMRNRTSMMVDLVGTCPKGFWEEWIAEGDPADAPESGEEWGWYTSHSKARLIRPGDRFYVVAHGKLRGYAPVVRVLDDDGDFVVIRRGGAVAVTLDEPVPGFRGLRERWWTYAEERPFPDWRTP